ncbi:MAG: alpha-glucan family phosphorylase [Fimbriimonadaceae bacterium]
MKHPKYAHSFEVFYELPEPLRELKRLAYNFRWTWHHETQELFREMDRTLWSEVEHNPVQLLNRIPRERLERLARDQMFLNDLGYAVEDLDRYLAEETWFDREYPGEREKTLIAYFCAEFGISEALPIYSGGLGVLAGDHLKAASDLGLPLVGVGLLYSRGYFRQVMTPDGWQQEVYPQYDFYNMPLTLVRGEDQQPIRVEIQLPERDIVCQVWRADVGRVPLYLLDSNVLENAPADQEITDTLYGGDHEMRIRQEMSLGVGGLRALRAVGLNPTVCHMNEGHAGFLVLERIRQFMKENGCEFRVARKVVVSGNCFTTHTPVPAGFDLFTADMVDRYTKRIYESMGIGMKDVIRLGRINDDNEGEAFNMAVLAMENSNHVNGVSKLHAEVARGMFHSKWPNYPEDEVPIESVTNGVHTMTWVSRRFAQLFDNYLGLEWRRNSGDPKVWEKVWDIPDIAMWEARENQRGDMVRYVRRRLYQQLERQGVSRTEIGAVEQILDPRYLTVGFARRFATYKRATLMLADRERLKRILNHPERPVQIILAGKSHPKDEPGKRMIQELINFIRNEGARARMVFLEDYDMAIARALVQGVDVWLNNPRRPYEASGTSGMKVVPNGGLNCSVLDGWWNEAYRPGVGWAIGERREYGDQGHQDWLDSLSLYHILETEIGVDRGTGADLLHRPHGAGVHLPLLHAGRQGVPGAVGRRPSAGQGRLDLAGPHPVGVGQGSHRPRLGYGSESRQDRVGIRSRGLCGPRAAAAARGSGSGSGRARGSEPRASGHRDPRPAAGRVGLRTGAVQRDGALREARSLGLHGPGGALPRGRPHRARAGDGDLGRLPPLERRASGKG